MTKAPVLAENRPLPKAEQGISLAITLTAAVSAAAGTIVRILTFAARSRFVVVAVSVLGAIILTVVVLAWANR
jgi:hypothetical protein